MQTTGLIDRVKDAWQRTATKVVRATQTIPVNRGATTRERLSERTFLTPAMDVLENDQQILICVDVPGAHPGNTEIHWDQQDSLSIYVRAEPVNSGMQTEADWYRAFRAPDYVDFARAESQLKNGVLTIALPKRKAAAARQVRVIEHVD